MDHVCSLPFFLGLSPLWQAALSGLLSALRQATLAPLQSDFHSLVLCALQQAATAPLQSLPAPPQAVTARTQPMFAMTFFEKARQF